MTTTTRRGASGTDGVSRSRRARRKRPPEPVGALRPGLSRPPDAMGDDPTCVGALRPGLGRPTGEPDENPEEPVGALRPGLRRPMGERCEPAPAAPAVTPPLWLAPLVLLGTAVAATGSAVARATGGVAAGPAIAAGARGVSYTGLVLLAGSLGFAALVWPEGLRSRRLAAVVWAGWLVVVLATVGQLVLRDGSGPPLPDRGRVVSALGLRLVLLLAAVVWVSAALTGRRAPRPVGLSLGLALAATWVYAGPAAPGWLTVAVTVVHIAAACVWAGGLAVLAVVLLPRGASAPLAAPLASFSRVATWCVAVLAASGVFHGWSRAGSLGDLFTTGYGHAFWLKLAAVGAMLVVANGNRLYVLRHVGSRPRTAEPPPLHMLGLFLGAEIAFGIVVMVLTGILVGAPVDG